VPRERGFPTLLAIPAKLRKKAGRPPGLELLQGKGLRKKARAFAALFSGARGKRQIRTRATKTDLCRKSPSDVPADAVRRVLTACPIP